MAKSSALSSLGPPVEKQGLQKTAYERIRKGILTGKIAPGMQLKIGEVATALNVSANPVREALRQLEAEGMVSFGKNRRIEVIQLSPEDLDDIYSLLIPLEIIALERCFKNIKPDNIKDLKTYCHRMNNTEIAGSKWIELNWHFHKKIHEMSASPRLVNMLRSLRNNITPYLYLSLHDKPRIEQANREHDLIIEALETKNRSLGEEVLRVHLSNGHLAISYLLKEQKV